MPVKKKISKKQEVITQHSDAAEEKAKYVLFEEYRCTNTWRLTPVSQKTLETLRAKATQWAKSDENALKISQFLSQHGIPRITWKRWKDKYPEIQEANEEMLMAIGTRREIGMITRKFDSGSTMKSMPIYDEDWKHIDEWKSKLTQKDGISGGQQFIVIEKAANSPLVPERKEEE